MAVKGGKRQTDRHVEAVLASCEIMDTFLHCPNQTLKQIIDQTSLSRNRVMRLAGTLEARGYLHQDSRTVGALGVDGPIHRFTPETLPGKTKLVMSVTAEFAWKLGGFPSQMNYPAASYGVRHQGTK